MSAWTEKSVTSKGTTFSLIRNYTSFSWCENSRHKPHVLVYIKVYEQSPLIDFMFVAEFTHQTINVSTETYVILHVICLLYTSDAADE